MTDGAAVNVLDFGAVGDGVTDSAGVIEYRSILSASGINYKILCYQKLA